MSERTDTRRVKERKRQARDETSHDCSWGREWVGARTKLYGNHEARGIRGEGRVDRQVPSHL